MPDCKYALVIFSLASSLKRVMEALRDVKEKDVILLSTCRLFETERDEITHSTDKNLKFYSFSDFIDEQEMIRCDEEADRILKLAHGERRHDLLPEYYALISTMKNVVIHDNVRSDFFLSNVLLLDCDLGINCDVWTDRGGVDLSEARNTRPRRSWSRFKGKKSSYLEYQGERFFFIGNSGRLRQFLSTDVELIPHGAWVNIFIQMLLLVMSRLSRSGSFLPRLLLFFVCKVFRALFLRHADGIATTLHEYGLHTAEVARCLGLRLTCLQDGFLPSNYTSAYIKFFDGIDRFLVFDDMSGKFFERFSLPYERSGIFRDPELSLFPEEPLTIRRILVVASGAGDWTALKNRSDEDGMFQAFVEVALRMPDILFVYRPHPLWVHPKHQGERSIQRLREYCIARRVDNIVVSEKAVKDSVRYGQEHNQSLCFPSIEEEIIQSDFVFGDHSQVMINACRMGKMFASVNFSSRISFFDSFNTMGFHHCTTVEQVVGLLKNLSESVEPVATHNAAVSLYNAFNKKVPMP